MERVLTCLIMLLWLLSVVKAQTVSHDEYWPDDNYADRTTVETTGSEVTLSVSTEQLAAGIHFLNFRAVRDDGVWGNYHRYLYYIPTLNSTSAGSVAVEYWLDDDRTGRGSEDLDGNQLSLAIDISQLTPGVHFFNCTPIGSNGERGNSERYLFYVPQPFDETTVAALAGYEYWIDDNYQQKTVSQDSETEQVLAISIDGLSSGVHYFNCRPMNERGAYGNPVRKMFYIPQTESVGDAALATAEYWIDDDYAAKVSMPQGDAQQAFTVDISQLGSGIHYFNYCAISDKGQRGNTVRQIFYIASSQELCGNEPLEYEYWIDGNTSGKVTGKGTAKEYNFSIDLSALEDGSHTFNFKAKNVLEQWSDTFTEAFEWLSPDVVITMKKDMMTYTNSRALDFTSPIEGLKAYVVTEVGEGKAKLQEVTTAVPAGTGLLLMGTADASYTIPYSKEMPAAVGNMLVGVTVDTTIGGNDLDYILKNGKFVKSNLGTIAAGKAYLRLITPQSRDVLSFSGEATGLNGVSFKEGQSEEVYNLNGQRVDKPAKGSYIINGKKVIRR